MPQKEAIEIKKQATNILKQKGKEWKAISLLNNGIEIDPNYTDLWYWKGFAFYRLGFKQKKAKFYKKALESYLRAETIAPNNIEIKIKIISTYAALDDTANMVESFKRAEEINPNHSEIKRMAKDFHQMEKLRTDTIKEYSEILDMAKKEIDKE